MKRTGVARNPLRKGEQLREKVEAQLAALKRAPRLVRSFFKAPSVTYITDWRVMHGLLPLRSRRDDVRT